MLAHAWPGNGGEAQAAAYLSRKIAEASISQLHVASWPLLTQELSRAYSQSGPSRTGGKGEPHVDH